VSTSKQNIIDIDGNSRCVIARGRGIVYIDDTFSGYFNTTDEILKDTPFCELINVKKIKAAVPVSDWWDVPPGYYALTLSKAFSKDKNTLIPCRIDYIESSNSQLFVMVSITSEAKDSLARDESFAQAVGSLAGFMERLGSFRNRKKPSEHLDEMMQELPSGSLIEDFRQFFNLSVDILAIADKTGRISKVNPSFRRLLGYSSEDISGKYFSDILHPEDRKSSGLFSLRKKMTVSQVPFQESRVICKDGSIRWLEWKSRALGNMMYIVASDVTSHKIYQSELAMRESQLRDAQKMARMGYWKWQIGEQQVHFSSHLYEIFGIKEASFNPTLKNIQKMVSARDQKRMQRFLNIILQTKETLNFDFKIQLNKKDERYVRCYGRCELGEEGDIVALYGLLQDITNEKKNRRDLVRAKRDAEAALRSKSRFLANMSHELRTPLNAIIGFSEVMKSELLGPLGSSQYSDYVTGIHESGQHLLDIISDILDMSKMEAKKYEIVKENINLAKSIRLAVHMIQNVADEREISVDLDVPENLPNIFADRRSVMQILANLLSNAVKFTNPGGWVTVTLRIEKDMATIKVEDTGIGIPANKVSRVTKPFEQVASALTRGHGGTGLGLAITKNLIELHGGTLHIASVEGEGTTVTVTLPVRHPDSINDNADKKNVAE